MFTQLLAIIRNGRIEPLETIDLPEGTQLIVTISSPLEIAEDSELEDWYALSLKGLSRAYSDEDPSYEISQVKEFNPSYRSYPTTKELTTLASQSGSFDFLAQEPDIYSLEDGEPIST
jgi:predicted DNA-binding antitoxin AbrB/MazE fold protein